MCFLWHQSKFQMFSGLVQLTFWTLIICMDLTKKSSTIFMAILYLKQHNVLGFAWLYQIPSKLQNSAKGFLRWFLLPTSQTWSSNLIRHYMGTLIFTWSCRKKMHFTDEAVQNDVHKTDTDITGDEERSIHNLAVFVM